MPYLPGQRHQRDLRHAVHPALKVTANMAKTNLHRFSDLQSDLGRKGNDQNGKD